MLLPRILSGLLVLLLAGTVQALPEMEWRYPAFPLRTIFQAPVAGSGIVMLKVGRVGSMPVTRDGFLACGSDGVPLPLRVVCAEGGEVALLVETPLAGAGSCVVYYGASVSGETVPSPEAAVERSPLAAGFMPLQGGAIPTSWERMRYMIKAFQGKDQTPYRMAGFDEVARMLEQRETSRDTDKSGKNRRPLAQVRAAVVRSFLLCPRTGTYRFAVDCLDAGFVVVDGELVAAWPGEHEGGSWRLGAPVSLKAGVHGVEVFNAFEGDTPKLRVGWLAPGDKEVVPLAVPDLIAAGEASETRSECMSRTLQPGFVATPQRGYSFRGAADVFTEVRFNNTAENWIAAAMTPLWRFGDGTQSAERNPIHVYNAAGRFKASLEVRDALGFVASCSKTVDCRRVLPEEYAVSFNMAELPAVCYGRDKVGPVLRLQGEGLRATTFDVSWEIRLRSGVLRQDHREVTLKTQPQFVPLAPVAAGELESLSWQVSHCRVKLGGEVIRFVYPPFAAVPVRVEGDRLYDAGGTRLVLIPDEGVSTVRRAPTGPVRRYGRLVCVDDSLIVGGGVEGAYEPFDCILARLLKGRVEEVRYVALPRWSQFPDAYGPLRKQVDVPAALRRERADVAILSIGVLDMLALENIDAFERQVAALSDVVTLAMNIPVVWVTPPPYSSDPERSRAFAAVIRRIAKTRGIPVADLFTTFRCAADGRHVFFERNPLVLSEQGHRLAGQQIVRALVGE